MKNLSVVKLLVLSVVLMAGALVANEAKAATAPCTIIGIPCSADMFFQRTTGQPQVLGASTTSIQCSLFTRNLKLGSTGADVTALQNFLIQKGFLTVPKGSTLGYFGAQTRAALARYQSSKRIKPVDGYFGPVTRQAVIADCNATVPDLIPPLSPLPLPQATTTTIIDPNSTCQTAPLNRDLTVGSSGNDVAALQNFLKAKGYLVNTSDASFGYFGAQTKAALAAYQVAKSITPVDGFFGPITRAVVNAECNSIPTIPVKPTILMSLPGGSAYKVGDTVNYGWSANYPMKVPYGYLYNSSGAVVSSKMLLATSTGSDSFLMASSTIPAGEYKIKVCDQGTEIINPVCGISPNFIVNAVIITTPRTLRVISPNGGAHYQKGDVITIAWEQTGTANPVYIDWIQDRDGVASYEMVYGLFGSNPQLPTGSLSWTIPGSIFSLDSAAVKNKIRAYTSFGNESITDESDEPFSVGSSTLPIIASTTASLLVNGQHSVTVNVGDTVKYDWNSTGGYAWSSSYARLGSGSTCPPGGTWAIYNASGTISSVIPSELSGCAYNIIYIVKNELTNKTATDSITVKVNPVVAALPTVTLSSSANPIQSQNYRVHPATGAQAVPLLNFNLKTETADAHLTSVVLATNINGTSPTAMYLYQGSTLISSSMGLFQPFDVVLPVNTIQNFTVKADFPPNTTNGTSVRTTVNSVIYKKGSGTASTTNPAVIGTDQYMYTAAPVFNLVSTPTIQISGTSQTGTSLAMTATFNFNVTALGGTMVQPLNTDVTVKFATSSLGAQLTATGVSVVTIPNNNIAEGSTATVTVTAQISAANVPASGLYNAYISNIRWTVGANTVDQNYGLESYKTAAAANFIASQGSLSSAKSLLTFNFAAQGATGVVDEVNHTVSVTVPFGTALTALTPSIAVSPNATVSPATGIVQNFTTPKVYTVRAQDGSTQTYLVTVTPEVPSALFALTSTPTIQISGISQTGTSLAMVATFNFNVTARGGDMIQPANTDFTVKFATSSSGVQLASSTVSVVTIPNNNIADGSTAAVTVTAQISAANVPASGLYNAYISSIKWKVGGNAVTQSTGLENYKTIAAANFIATAPTSASFTIVTPPTIQISGTSQTGSSTAMTATYQFNVSAIGGTLLRLSNSDFGIKFATSTVGAQLSPAGVSVVTIPSGDIAAGNTASVTVTAQIPSYLVPRSGLYYAYISTLRWSVGGIITNQSPSLETYKTSNYANFIK